MASAPMPAASQSAQPAPAPELVAASATKLGGYEFYKSIGSPKFVVAPMVDQSELAWRLLSRSPLPTAMAGPSTTITPELKPVASPSASGSKMIRNDGGAHLVYTPMIHAKVFSQSKMDSRGGDSQFDLTHGEEGSYDPLAGIDTGDRPLFVQFCANDPEILLAAAKKVESRCDAVDINFGCPQGIARRGHYGSFLQDEWDLVRRLISTLHDNLAVPVTAKFRIFPDVNKTIAYAQMMEAAGAQILTCHGRTRDMKGQLTGLADWEQIKAVKKAVKVPVFANGNVLYREDVDRCMEFTGCDGVMSAEGNLSNPALFVSADHKHAYPHATSVARRYLDIVESLRTATSPSAIKSHLFRLLKPILDENEDFLRAMGQMSFAREGVAGYRAILDQIDERMAPLIAAEPEASATAIDPVTGYRKVPVWCVQPYIRCKPISTEVGGDESLVSAELTESTDAAAVAPTIVLPSIHCVHDGCSSIAASRCPTAACIIHCRLRRAVAAGMDPETAEQQAKSGGLEGMGCDAHEGKAAARKLLMQARKELRVQGKKARKARRMESGGKGRASDDEEAAANV